MLSEMQRNFLVFPSVFPSGVRSHVAIIPTEARLAFRTDTDYPVFVWPMEEEKALSKKEPDFMLRGTDAGTLEFDYLFTGEESYQIRILNYVAYGKPVEQTLRFDVYVLHEELYSLLPLKGDLHIHTCASDGKEDPAVVAANYRALGYDFISITDHNRLFGSEEAIEVYRDLPIDLKIFPGEEVHTPGSNLHIVHPLASESVAERYVRHRESYESEVSKILSAFPEDQPYREKLARAKWAIEKIHEAGDIAVLPHPFWQPNVYNLSHEFLLLLFRSGYFDCYELMGAQETSGNNLSLAIYQDLRAEGLRMPVIGNSDAHSTPLSGGRFGDFFTVALAKENSREGIIDAIKSFRTVAVEYDSASVRKSYRAYGEYRLVSYARFLIDQYFPYVLEIAESEGKLMRESLITGSPEAKALLQSYRGREDAFRRLFFGLDTPAFDTSEYRSTVQKYRAVWANYGTEKRGSKI